MYTQWRQLQKVVEIIPRLRIVVQKKIVRNQISIMFRKISKIMGKLVVFQYLKVFCKNKRINILLSIAITFTKDGKILMTGKCMDVILFSPLYQTSRELKAVTNKFII